MSKGFAAYHDTHSHSVCLFASSLAQAETDRVFALLSGKIQQAVTAHEEEDMDEIEKSGSAAQGAREALDTIIASKIKAVMGKLSKAGGRLEWTSQYSMPEHVKKVWDEMSDAQTNKHSLRSSTVCLLTLFALSLCCSLNSLSCSKEEEQHYFNIASGMQLIAHSAGAKQIMEVPVEKEEQADKDEQTDKDEVSSATPTRKKPKQNVSPNLLALGGMLKEAFAPPAAPAALRIPLPATLSAFLKLVGVSDEQRDAVNSLFPAAAGDNVLQTCGISQAQLQVAGLTEGQQRLWVKMADKVMGALQ